MKKRKGSILQRIMAVLLSAVLVMSMAWEAAPINVLAQESVDRNAPEPAEGEIEPAEGADSEGQEPGEGTEQGTPQPGEGTEQGTPQPDDGKEETPEQGNEEEKGQESASENNVPTDSVSENDTAEIAQAAWAGVQVMAAAETHKHPVCGGSCGHSDEAHPDVEWTPLTRSSITANSENDYYKLTGGNYYLTEDISIDRMLKCAGKDKVSLCFNGHKITSSYNGTGFNNSSLAAYEFNACDCGSGGGFISTGRYLLSGTGYANLNLYGGNFVGENTVYLYTDTLTLDGATLKATGTAVNIQSLGKAFIKSGSVTSSGTSTVHIYSTNFTMSGGTVTNTGSGSALSFSYDQAGTITGGTITAEGSSGKGINILGGTSVTLSGSPAISGGGGDIVVMKNSRIIVNGLTAKYGIGYAYPENITESAPAAFTVVAPNDYSEYFEASDALIKSGLALRKAEGGTGDEQTVEIYRPHKITHCAEVPATCTADGTGEYWKCTNNGCGKLFSDADGNTEITNIPVKSALGHNKDGNVAHEDATCTEEGVKGGIYCTRCNDGKAEAETVIPATGHDYRWNITRTPTMTAGGTAAGVCRNDSTHKETKTLPALTDTTFWTVGDKEEPTKDKDGSQAYISEYGTVTVTLPSYAKIAAAAKKIVEEALAKITATNATTKENIQSVIDAALDEAKKTNTDIAGVTVTVGELTKKEATDSAAGSIEGSILISCGEGADKAEESVPIDKPIAQLPAEKYTVTVNNGTGGGAYKAGDTVTITANAPASGKQFDKWTVDSGSVTLASAKSSTTTFTMPAGEVEVTATYKNKTGGGSHSGGSGGDNQGGGNQGGGSNGGNGGNNGGAGGSSGTGSGSGAGTTAGKPGTSGTGQPKVKQEKKGNIQKEVRVEGEATLDATVTTTLSELADIVLTEAEKQQAAAGTNIRIVLDVKEVPSVVNAADKAIVEAALGSSSAKGYTLGQYLDINLYKLVGSSRSNITQTSRKITVTMKVPDSLKNTDGEKTRTFAVIRVHDGKAEWMTDLDNEEDTITIETDRFSTYAIVYQDTAGENGGIVRVSVENGGNKKTGGGMDDEPKTGDATPIELAATLSMIAGFTYLLLYFADRRRGMTEETKKELVSRLIGWGKRGGRVRRYLALAAIFVLLVYYHSIGKKTCVEWKEIYGE